MKTMRRFGLGFGLVLVLGELGWLAQGAVVGAGGYTNDFSSQPPAADWATYSISGGSGDISTAAGLDSAVQGVGASAITSQVGADAASPPGATANAMWSSSGGYLQTRPTGNAATLLLCRLINGLDVEAIAVTIRYTQTQTDAVTEEVPAHRAYWSLSGAAGSWTVIPQLSSAVDGVLTATLTITWLPGATLYLLWADDNGSGTPDTSVRIDNFSVTLTPGTQVPVTITAHPQSQTVDELAPVSFAVGVRGYPVPTVQWYANDVPIAGATNLTYSIAEVPLSYNGLRLWVVAQNVVSNLTYTATSAVATLTVRADLVGPVLLGAASAGLDQVVAWFSERLDPVTATNPNNYWLTGPSGSLIVSNAVLDSTQTNVTLRVSPMTPNAVYTLRVSGVTDRAAAANPIAPGSQVQFLALSYAPLDIGNPALAGWGSLVGGTFQVSGAGTNIAGTSDQFFFYYQAVAGNFDVKTRVESLSLVDLWTKAGLMARETLATNARFAMVVATPSAAGLHFLYRATVGGVAVPTNTFPANYPNTWLRLVRSNTVFSGFASFDGQSWVQLGSVTLSSPAATFYVGFAVSSMDPSRRATAQFSEFGPTVGGTIVPRVSLPWEPLGPSSRNTGLVISEIMYHPKRLPHHTNQALEFIEIFNAGLIGEDLGGYRIEGSVTYTFPSNTVLPAGGFLVVARNPAALREAYGGLADVTVLGPWIGAETNALPDDLGVIRLRNRGGGVPLQVTYQGANPWPLAADGAGHSLVLARPSYGQDRVEAWAASDQIGGSPGRPETFTPEPLRNVLINEFFASSEPPDEDYIELYNCSAQPVNLGGAYLSDDRDTNKFRIPVPFILPPRGFAVFRQSELGFALNRSGERIYLINSNQTRVVEVVAFEGQASGISSGRFPDGAPGFHELSSRTPGAANSGLFLRPVVINEIMFNPITDDENDEYVELYNRSAEPVDLSNWRFTAGIDFLFPHGTVLPGYGYLVVAKNAARLLSKYPQLNSANTLGDYGGRLANGGERLALAMPEYRVSINNAGRLVTNIVWVVVDEVSYVDAGRWGRWADGGGSSLELMDPNSDNRLAPNWADSDETGKSQWTNFVFSALMDHVYPRGSPGADLNEVQVMILGAGEALMDDVFVHAGPPGSGNSNLVVNPNFDNGLTNWVIQGNHVYSSLEPAGPGNPSPSLRIRATAGGDNGANRVECDLLTALVPNTVGTLGARLRWLRGHPDVLLRLHGGGLEAVATLPVPANLGTPGLPNSRLVTNAGPAIWAVSHSPVLPAAHEAVVVTARVSDLDGVGAVELRYRIDPSSTLTTVVMRDDGTGADAVAGDGCYSGTIPGQPSGTLVAFRIVASDARTPAASTVFPPNAPTGECLVRFGDPPSFGTIGVYRMWMTAANINTWTTRERLSNQGLDGTFVYNDYRAIYNATARYRGSPFIRPGYNTPTGNACGYLWTFPDDDQFLGEDEMNLDSLEPSGRDSTALREVTSFTILDQLNLQWSYQRFVHVIINGVHNASRGIPLYSDSQQVNASYVRCWFADEPEGEIFKIDDWFEFDDSVARQLNKSASLEVFLTTNAAGLVVPKQARYRWCWEKKFNRTLNDDYSSLYAAAYAKNAPDALYVQQVNAIFDIEQWLTMLAFRHVVGDWDGYGYNRGKNQFIYRPPRGKWYMLMWDLDFAIGCNGGHGPEHDLFAVALGGATGENHMPEVNRMYNHPHFRRIYMQALLRMADGPLHPAAYGPVLEARYRAIQANNVSTVSPYVGSGAQGISIPAWLDRRRTYIYQQLASATNVAFAVTSPTTVTTSSNLLTITGNAPLTVKTIRINDTEYPITWTTVTAWSIRVPLPPGTTTLTIQPIDLAGNLMAGSVRTVTATVTGALDDPTDALVFSEIMFDPAVPGAEYVELYNRSTTTTFDLSGWRISGLAYSFPAGSFIGPRSYLLLVKDAHACLTAYGTNLPIFGQFAGNLRRAGETLTLLKPGPSPDQPIIVDRIRYEGALPWDTNAVGTGSSLQLIDVIQDNSRPCNWFSGFVPARWSDPIFFPGATNAGWRYVAVTGTLQSNAHFYIWFQGGGLQETHVDDIKLVLGSVPEQGPNLLENGDFESEFSGPWTFVGTNLTNSVITTEVARSGQASLRVISTASGNQNRAIMQVLPPRPTNAICTLSFWFLTSSNGTNLVVRSYPGSLLNATTNVQPEILPPSYTPPRLISAATNYLSPGAPNRPATNLPYIPPLWLNEVQPENLTGLQTASGRRAPWIELYNAGPNVESLDGLYLSDNYTNLTQWAFPSGATIGPGECKIIFADGVVSESTLDELHANFILRPGAGSLALSRLHAGQPQVLDYINYTNLLADWSYGSLPDGQPFERRIFIRPSPGQTNSAPPVTVLINEWLASNVNPGGYPDPVDNQYDDWFELYNPSDEPADISGMYLTDNLANKTQWQIPPGYVIPPRGFLLVWADNQPEQNGLGPFNDLHAPFALRAAGEAIGLFARVGTNLVEIDSVVFGPQQANVSEGRYPDGSPNREFMSTLTPRAPNVSDSPALNTPPEIEPIPVAVVWVGQTLNCSVVARDAQAPPQVLTFSLIGPVPSGASLHPSTGAFQWTPTVGHLGTNHFTVRVSDNGVPSLSATQTFLVVVVEPQPPRIVINPPSNSGDLTLSFDTVPGKRYRLEYKDDLSNSLWGVLHDNILAIGGRLDLIVNVRASSSPQRFFRIVCLD